MQRQSPAQVESPSRERDLRERASRLEKSAQEERKLRLEKEAELERLREILRPVEVLPQACKEQWASFDKRPQRDTDAPRSSMPTTERAPPRAPMKSSDTIWLEF